MLTFMILVVALTAIALFVDFPMSLKVIILVAGSAIFVGVFITTFVLMVKNPRKFIFNQEAHLMVWRTEQEQLQNHQSKLTEATTKPLELEARPHQLLELPEQKTPKP